MAIVPYNSLREFIVKKEKKYLTKKAINLTINNLLVNIINYISLIKRLLQNNYLFISVFF